MIGSLSTFRASPLLRIDPPMLVGRGVGRVSAFQSQQRARALDDLSEKLGSLRSVIDALEGIGPTRSSLRIRGRAAEATTSPLALEAVPRDATLRSTGEVNATPTSFTPFEPVVSGSTTSQPLVGGVYDGDQGDDTLTFEFRRNGVVGSGQRINVRVYDGAGTRIETLRFEDVPVDEPLTLKNGLTLALGAGSVTRLDTFEVQVSTSVGSQVDPTMSFDGTGNSDPNFEPGVSVGAGSFNVNGVAIVVVGDDSIDSLLLKINTAGIGVTATFDAGSESVVLTHDDPTQTITVGNDTSGFLAAAKLESAVFEPGQDATLANDPIGGVAALSGASDGTFQINGVSIAVDTATDSLEDIVARINGSGANVTATLDASTFELSIVSQDRDAAFTLDDESSGFFSAVGLASGDYRPVEGSVARSGFEDLDAVKRELSALGAVLDDLLSPVIGGLSDLDFVSARLRSAIEASFDDLFQTGSTPILRSGFGLDFDFTREGGAFQLDAKRFERESIESFGELEDFLFEVGADGTTKGLLATLARVAAEQQAVVDVSRAADPKGGLLDLLA